MPVGCTGPPEGIKNRPLELPWLRCDPRLDAVCHGRTAPCRQQKTREQIHVRTADGGWQVGERRRPVGKGPCTVDLFDLTSLLEHHRAVLRRHVKLNNHIRGQRKRRTEAHQLVQHVAAEKSSLEGSASCISTRTRTVVYTKSSEFVIAATGDGKYKSPRRAPSPLVNSSFRH